MKEVNGVIFRSPRNKNEEWWFSQIADKINKAEFGEIKLTITLKGGKVVNIKNIEITENINAQGFI